MVWLVKDWMLGDDAEGWVGGKRVEEKRAKEDPMASEYIYRQRVGSCLQEFMMQVFRPKPKKLGLPGFDKENTSDLWVVKEEETRPEPGRCCIALSCRAPGSNLNV